MDFNIWYLDPTHRLLFICLFFTPKCRTNINKNENEQRWLKNKIVKRYQWTGYETFYKYNCFFFFWDPYRYWILSGQKIYLLTIFIYCIFPLAMPMGQMPVLEVDGHRVHQSISMARYVAKRVGLGGTNDWENLIIDTAVDTVNDFRLSKYQLTF